MTMITNNFYNLVNETTFALQQQYHGLKKTICALPTIHEDFEWKPTSTNHVEVFEDENAIVQASSVVIVMIPQRPRSTGFHADELSCEWAQQLGFQVRRPSSSSSVVPTLPLTTRPRRPRAECLDAHVIAQWMMER